ncbi:MAG TPA: hypothetical protein VEJ67_01190 [Candidatus Cybelea sp.]|nr:hypothetical protein [Candidatus Cybelea sp.]
MRQGWSQRLLFVTLAVIALLGSGHLASPGASAVPPAPALAQPPDPNTSAPQPYPVMNRIADKLIQKYQTSSCQQLSEDRIQRQGQPRSPEEQRAIAVLHNDPQMRQAFINKVAGPIANKMFECGMIP